MEPFEELAWRDLPEEKFGLCLPAHDEPSKSRSHTWLSPLRRQVVYARRARCPDSARPLGTKCRQARAAVRKYSADVHSVCHVARFMRITSGRYWLCTQRSTSSQYELD